MLVGGKFYEEIVDVMKITYLETESVRGRVWLAGSSQERNMAALSTIFNDGRSRTSENGIARMQILSRSGVHISIRRRPVGAVKQVRTTTTTV